MPAHLRKNSKATKPEIIRNNKSSETTKGGPKLLLLPKKCIKIPRKSMFDFDMENINYIESHKGDSIFEFIPSKTMASNDQLTKNLDVHIEALEKFISSSFNFVQNYEFLISSAKEVLRLIRCYIKDTKSPAFNFKWRLYIPPLRPREEYTLNPDVSAYTCILDKNGRVRVYLDSPWIDQVDFLPSALTVPASFQEGYYLPLNIEESKIWLEFKNLDKGNPESVFTNSTFDEEEEKRSISLSYPLVGVIGGFAVAAFNKACAMIKKDEHNIHDFEYMECKYVKDSKAYFFYMTIEAIEEGNLGVYEAIVACSRDDGVRTLLKFVLTDRTPVGTKAMAISLLSCLRSLIETLRELKEEKSNEHVRIYYHARGMERGKALKEAWLLAVFHRKTIRGIRRVLSLNLQLLFQTNCTRRSAPDDWLPHCCYYFGIVPRNIGTPCRGYDYDYYNQYFAQHLSNSA